MVQPRAKSSSGTELKRILSLEEAFRGPLLPLSFVGSLYYAMPPSGEISMSFLTNLKVYKPTLVLSTLNGSCLTSAT